MCLSFTVRLLSLVAQGYINQTERGSNGAEMLSMVECRLTGAPGSPRARDRGADKFIFGRIFLFF